MQIVGTWCTVMFHFNALIICIIYVLHKKQSISQACSAEVSGERENLSGGSVRKIQSVQ
jgi:hypothetical protein